MPQEESIVPANVVETLVANHKRFLAFLESRVGSRETAEEILQAAYIKGIERGGEIRDEESAIAWFYRLLRNSIIDHYRSNGARNRSLERLTQELESGSKSHEQELEGIVCACVNELIPTLKPEYANLLSKVEIQGRSVREVAEEEGISANNAAVRLHRARLALKSQLEQTCGTCTEHGCLDCTCDTSHKKSCH